MDDDTSTIDFFGFASFFFLFVRFVSTRSGSLVPLFFVTYLVYLGMLGGEGKCTLVRWKATRSLRNNNLFRFSKKKKK
ncbi:hypothetical protein F4811DRAFT_523167, partial [Daldinia bambusicola]